MPPPPHTHRTCLPGVRRYYKVGVKPREFRKKFLECLVVSYVILVVDMRFVIKVLALMALPLGEDSTLTEDRNKQSLRGRKHTKSLERDFLLFCLPTTT